MNTFLYGVFPYICLVSFVVGHVWRYRFDKFGWTTRSSQLYEGKLLAIASPLFHFGILFVFAGHFLGLLVPESFTVSLGVTEPEYRLIASVPGTLAGIATVVGLTILVWRRGFTRSILQVTSPMDYVMYVLLIAIIVLGMYNTINYADLGSGYDYRLDISPWFRSIFVGQPSIDLMASAPMSYEVHALVAFALIGIWPYTRLVHVWSVPLAYIARPYVVYRTQDTHRGARAPRRGWDRPGF